MRTMGGVSSRRWMLSCLVAMAALATIGCGGKTGGSSPKGQKWVCDGKYHKTNLDGTLIVDSSGTDIGWHTLTPNRKCPTDVEASVEPFACVCEDLSVTAASVSKDKCISELAKWEAKQSPQTFKYEWNITGASEADEVNPLVCNPTADDTATIHIALMGGRSQYATNVTGTLDLAVNYSYTVPWPPFTESGTATGSSAITAVVEYNITGGTLGSCPAGGCNLTIQRFGGHAADFGIGGKSVTGVLFHNETVILGKIQNDGTFATESTAGDLSFFYNVDGVGNTMLQNLASPITGKLSPDGKTITFDSFAISQDDATVTLSGITGSAYVSPPQLSFTPTGNVECQSPQGSLVTLDGSASTGGKGEYYWKIDSDSYMFSVGPTFQTQLALGSHTIGLAMENPLGGVGSTTAKINVVDTTKPTIQTIGATTVNVCDIAGEGVKIPLPTVNDGCTGIKQLTGKVVSKNGTALTPPIDLTDGAGKLPVGNFEVLWQVTDNAGNVNEARQAVAIVPAVYATTNTFINDNGKVRSASGPNAVIANGSGGQVEIKYAGEVGEIQSLSKVVLRNKAKVYGGIWSTGDISVGDGASAASYHRFSSVVLPPPSWPSATMPTGGTDFYTNNQGENRLMAPGAYANVGVHPNTTVRIVAAGLYSIQSLTVDSNATLDLSGVTGNVKIVAGNWFAFRGKLIAPTASTARVTIVYLGTTASFIETAFPANASYYAPNGRVVIGQSGGQLFVGAVTAKEIEISNSATVICRLN